VTEQQPPKIEFPCSYPIKVLGRSSEQLHPTVVEIFERHAPGFDASTMTMRSSSGGKFLSITVTIEATGKPQLEALHRDLMATGLVKMVM
jgi:putative lipoic acid-binding regulatory protein